MTYCTAQNLSDRFGTDEMVQLTDRARVGVVDTVAIDRAIADASGTIDGYLAARYTLPVAVALPVLERVCADIARYFLHGDRMTDLVKTRYDDAIAFLKAVSRGEVDLGLSAGGEPAPAASSTIEIESGDRVFGRGGGGFI